MDPDGTESGRDLVSLELSHRIRNIFAVVSGLVELSARGQPEMRPLARALQARIDALAAAHRYISPRGAAPASSAGSETVKGLLRILTAPYKGHVRETIAVEGEDASLGLQAAGTLALIVHELATNAVKHGALSCETGRVSVSCSMAEGCYTIVWREHGGPSLAGAPRHKGFGSTFFDRLIASAQVDIQRNWRAEGLEASISMSLEALEA